LAYTLALAVVFDLFSGIIALLVSYYAFQVRRLLQSSSVLSALSFGFMLLGAGLIVEVVISLSVGLTAADALRFRTFELFEDLGYLLLQVTSLLIIAVGYAQTTFGRKKDAPPAALSGLVAFAVTATTRAAKLAGLKLLLYNAFLGLEFIILFVLVFIIFQGILIYAKSRDGSSLLVLLGFAMIFVSHIVVLRSVLDVSGYEYLVAAAIQFVGFLSLLVFVVRSGRIGSA
jgi:hypothetical protein